MAPLLPSDWLQVRTVIPELMDRADPRETARTLSDIRRLNLWFGGHRILQQALRSLPSLTPSTSFSFLDVGAASGDMGESLRHSHPNARIVSLDLRAHHLARNRFPAVAADAFALPFAPNSIDIVFTSLFLHHFPNAQVIQLLANFWTVCRRAVVCIDLERHPIPLRFVPATRRLFRWNGMTCHDAPASVASSFRRPELESLARQAGLHRPSVRTHVPWFRHSLVALKELS